MKWLIGSCFRDSDSQQGQILFFFLIVVRFIFKCLLFLDPPPPTAPPALINLYLPQFFFSLFTFGIPVTVLCPRCPSSRPPSSPSSLPCPVSCRASGTSWYRAQPGARPDICCAATGGQRWSDCSVEGDTAAAEHSAALLMSAPWPAVPAPTKFGVKRVPAGVWSQTVSGLWAPTSWTEPPGGEPGLCWGGAGVLPTDLRSAQLKRLQEKKPFHFYLFHFFPVSVCRVKMCKMFIRGFRLIESLFYKMKLFVT